MLGNVWKDNLIDLPAISEKSICGKERVSAMGLSISLATEFATPKTWRRSRGLWNAILEREKRNDRDLGI
jgi:hypothetical protein